LCQVRILCHSKESLRHQEIINQAPIEVSFDSCEKEGLKKLKKSSRRIKSYLLGELQFSVESAENTDGKRTTPKEIRDLAPKGKSFSYDTIWQVTKMHYLDHMRRSDIQKALAFPVSTGSISNLYKAGLAYFRACHEAALPTLRQYYREIDSPFILQIDGTNEGGTTVLFQVRHSATGHILYCQKIPTENEADIVAILAVVENRFGQPDAIISDMAASILAAVKTQWREKVPHYLCQFHFLRDLGKDLLAEQHEILHKIIRPQSVNGGLKVLKNAFVKNKEKYKNTANEQNYQQGIDMIDWILDFRHELKGQGIPFDLAWKVYYERVTLISEQITKILSSKKRKQEGKEAKILKQIQLHLKKVTSKNRASRAYNQLNQDNELFNQIREIFHIMQESNTPLSQDVKAKLDEQENKTLQEELQKTLLTLAEFARQTKEATPKKRYQKAIVQINKYQDLLANQIIYKEKLFSLPRTNNLCETKFRDHKRGVRRTTGNKNLSRIMDKAPAEIMLLQNLDDPKYLELVFGGRPIYEAFAKVSEETHQQILEGMDQTSQGNKKSTEIKKSNFLELNAQFFMGKAA
jgi:hypothetical protein